MYVLTMKLQFSQDMCFFVYCFAVPRRRRKAAVFVALMIIIHTACIIGAILSPGSHDSISIRAKQKGKQRNEVKPANKDRHKHKHKIIV